MHPGVIETSMENNIIVSKSIVINRETRDEIRENDVVRIEKIIDQENPCVFVYYGSGSAKSFPISLEVFKFAFEEITG